MVTFVSLETSYDCVDILRLKRKKKQELQKACIMSSTNSQCWLLLSMTTDIYIQ